jgi:deazaflavin-dependent oxidoreductase (nitroreductase family)
LERDATNTTTIDPSPVAGQEPYCYLETVGRVSGRPHTVEMWFAADGATLYLLPGGGDRADWVKNLGKQPRVRVRVGTTTYSGTASVVKGAPEEPRAREALAAKYYGWRDGPLPNRWSREALPVAVRLDGVGRSAGRAGS